MSIVSNDLKQKAVYWPEPVNDGFGGFSYGTPIEVDCRWIEKSELIKDDKGTEVVSQARVKLNFAPEVNGYLWEGTLLELAEFLGIGDSSGASSEDSTSGTSSDDSTSMPTLDPDTEADPEKILGAFRIMKVTKTPSLQGTLFRRTAFL